MNNGQGWRYKGGYHGCHNDLEQSLEPRRALCKAAGIPMQEEYELTFS